MRMRGTRLGSWLGWLLGGMLGFGVVGPAPAETVNCTAITALPAVITVQGVYCLTGNLTAAIMGGNAIDIQTSNVVLDLNGYKLAGLGAGTGTLTTGIHANNRQNITIKNGTVRGFFNGIFLDDSAGGVSRGHVVEDIRADQNRGAGIFVHGAAILVRNNQVVATGGSTAFGPDEDASGILVKGTATCVLNNDVSDTVKQGAGTARGIYFSGCTGCLAVNNRIMNADKGIEYALGDTGKFRDNLTFGVGTPFTGGTNVGNNN